MTRVIVAGCRHWDCKEIAKDVASRLHAHYRREVVVVHGAAPGVDSAFEAACKKKALPTEPHPARWDEHGKRAGPLRNQEMADAGADFCLAVHRDLANSRGTGDMVRRCLAAGIPVFLIDGVNPIRKIKEL